MGKKVLIPVPVRPPLPPPMKKAMQEAKGFVNSDCEPALRHVQPLASSRIPQNMVPQPSPSSSHGFCYTPKSVLPSPLAHPRLPPPQQPMG